jgi:hypothetical protein
MESLHTKLWASKIVGVLILRFALKSFGTKRHLNASPMIKHKVYYKGEGDGFPQIQAVVIREPKVFQRCTKQFVVWFVEVVLVSSLINMQV